MQRRCKGTRAGGPCGEVVGQEAGVWGKQGRQTWTLISTFLLLPREGGAVFSDLLSYVLLPQGCLLPGICLVGFCLYSGLA